MKKWRSLEGIVLREGDIIEDLDRRAIGEVKIVYGLPSINIQKEFNSDILGFAPVDLKGPDEAYIRPWVERHTKLWWWLHRYTLPVLMLKPRPTHRQRT